MVYVLSLIILILLILLARKRKLETDQRKALECEIEAKLRTINNLQTRISEAQEQYHNEINRRTEDLDSYFEERKNQKQKELDDEFARQEQERTENLSLQIQQLTSQTQSQINQIETETQTKIAQCKEAQSRIEEETALKEECFNSLIASLKQYEKEKEERLYATIQIPEEYRNDIDFLLTSVSQKVRHPDIISKLVWTEYVRPYLEATFRRIDIEDKSGIYKLTNIENNKCYIGKSTNIKKRISDHFKASVGINSIADQQVHHEILNSGIWNWTIEVIIYCEKDKLNEMEKYYIEFFKSNSWGFNKTKGGEG